MRRANCARSVAFEESAAICALHSMCRTSWPYLTALPLEPAACSVLRSFVSLVLAKQVSFESVVSFFHWPRSPLRSCPALMHSCAGRPVASCSMNLVAWSNFPFWLCAVQLPVGDPRIRTWVNVAVGVNRIVKGKAGRGRGERGGGRKGRKNPGYVLDGHRASLSYSRRQYGVARLQASITSPALQRFQEGGGGEGGIGDRGIWL